MAPVPKKDNEYLKKQHLVEKYKDLVEKYKTYGF